MFVALCDINTVKYIERIKSAWEETSIEKWKPCLVTIAIFNSLIIVENLHLHLPFIDHLRNQGARVRNDGIEILNADNDGMTRISS